ncbi:MAG: T9SS type A sorting domain-containing protein, partial [Candidatus Thermoplasmatota archaeon]|nr:T9SS type A sorting domain-containing protein [Candidatus Thermoplasmatota archaeon]
IKKNSVFYLLNTCSACRWDEFVSAPTDPNYLGGLYVFDKSHSNGDFGLGAIGFTGVGGFNNLNFFTQYYDDHPYSNYGEMYVYWFNKNLQINFNTHNYVFLGDPTISPAMPLENSSVSVNPFLIKEYCLSHNYPNPFNPTTTIRFFIPIDTYVRLTVYDVLGKEIETLVSRRCIAGENKVKWNADRLPSGIYFYRLEAGELKATKKMILQK